MSIFKDWRVYTTGESLEMRSKHALDPRVWLRLQKWRTQRADRGWSDNDLWGAGDHIAKMTARMLQELNDTTYTDWPEWFKLNVQEQEGYKDLQTVIDDINDYLDIIEITWAEGLQCRGDGKAVDFNVSWFDESGKKLSEKEIKRRMAIYEMNYRNAYEAASKAMQFFARHFASFWD